MTFNIGPASAPDAVANETIPLPAGNYTNLFMLGAMVNNINANQTFIVTYTDGTTTTFNQNMSDWFNAAGWPGESVVSCEEDRNFDNGTTQADSVCVYGYQIPLNVNKTVQSVQLPGTRNIVMLAFDLTTPAIPGTFVYNPPAGTVEPVGTDPLIGDVHAYRHHRLQDGYGQCAAGGRKRTNPHRHADDFVADAGIHYLRHAFELHAARCRSDGYTKTHAGGPHQPVAGNLYLYRRHSL